jgi:hypothetical protein
MTTLDAWRAAIDDLAAALADAPDKDRLQNALMRLLEAGDAVGDWPTRRRVAPALAERHGRLRTRAVVVMNDLAPARPPDPGPTFPASAAVREWWATLDPLDLFEAVDDLTWPGRLCPDAREREFRRANFDAALAVVTEVVNGGGPVVDLSRFDGFPNWMLYVHPLVSVVARRAALECDVPLVVVAAPG